MMNDPNLKLMMSTEYDYLKDIVENVMIVYEVVKGIELSDFSLSHFNLILN
jgi:hypothetical protein